MKTPLSAGVLLAAIPCLVFATLLAAMAARTAAQVKASSTPTPSARVASDRALEIAVKYLREHKLFRSNECDIRLRRQDNETVISFIFLPARPGFDVTVVVDLAGAVTSAGSVF